MVVFTSSKGPSLALLAATAENKLITRNEKFLVTYIENGLVGLGHQKNSEKDAISLIQRLQEQNGLLRWDSANSHSRLGGSVTLLWEKSEEPNIKQKLELTYTKCFPI